MNLEHREREVEKKMNKIWGKNRKRKSVRESETCGFQWSVKVPKRNPAVR